MTHLPSDDYLELQRVQRELAANRRKISELEELINEVPAIYERKFDQKLQPLVEDVRLLSERNQALREQLRHALSPAAPAPTARPEHPGDSTAPPSGPAAPAPVTASEPSRQPTSAAPAASSPPAPAPAEPAAAAPPTEGATPPQAPSEPQRQPARNRPTRWRALPPWLARPRRRRPSGTQAAERAPRHWPPLTWPSVRWPRPTQRPRPVLLALLTAAGVGVVGGLGLQQWRLHASGVVAAASRAGGDNASSGREAQPGLTLQIRSSSETWLDVRNQRGAPLYAGLFSGERRFPIGQGLRLNAGKPELVTVRIGDGPERRLDHPGWWMWHSFGPDGSQRAAPQ